MEPRPSSSNVWLGRTGVSQMKESAIESMLVQEVEARGGLCQKITHPGRRGCPDRLVTWPDGTMQLVELKRPKGGKVSAAQTLDHRARARRNVFVYILCTQDAVMAYLAAMKYHWNLVV